jgi:elongation of very long chain fatty acids protein 6
MAMRLRPKWLNPIIITAFQISQMIVGVAVTLVAFYYYLTDDTCMIERENNTAAMVMYGSYLFLFMQFFVARYFKAQASKKKKTA